MWGTALEYPVAVVLAILHFWHSGDNLEVPGVDKIQLAPNPKAHRGARCCRGHAVPDVRQQDAATTKNPLHIDGRCCPSDQRVMQRMRKLLTWDGEVIEGHP